MVVYLVCFSFLLSFVCSGDHNIIVGDGNQIKGDKNVQVGHSSLLVGNSNWNFGNNQKIEGDDILAANGFQLIGDHHTNVNNLKRAEHKKLEGIKQMFQNFNPFQTDSDKDPKEAIKKEEYP